MRKLIAAFNITMDGFCDHTALIADDETHQHYSRLLCNADAILYGRITYQLMEFWPTLLKIPSGNKAMDEFAVSIDKIPKIVFSHTLKSLEWNTARLPNKDIIEEVLELKQQPGKDILTGSRSLIVSLLNKNLIDEFQLCVQPIIAGKGLSFFENINNRIEHTLLKTKTFACGAVVFYYQPIKNDGSFGKKE